MCGIAGVVGRRCDKALLDAAAQKQQHRGPDASGCYTDPSGAAYLIHQRLSIIDLSSAGKQPFCDPERRFWIVYNGEIYNYLELRAELRSSHTFRTNTDTEVLLAAYQTWGPDCLDKLIGMFAFAVWDEREKVLFAARDRFGVKPFYYHMEASGSLLFASEIKALHALGIERKPNPTTWATYFAHGLYNHSRHTFWNGVTALLPGEALMWNESHLRRWTWYQLPDYIPPYWDERPEHEVQEEYRALLEESVALRFRADVPVGINLSGGLDSSTLLGLVQATQGTDRNIAAFTFSTGDSRYDELPWVQHMLAQTSHPHYVCSLHADDVPELALTIQDYQDEPFGGLPTLAYAKIFERARALGVLVLLDGQGLDEQWAGYDYYARAAKVPQDTSSPDTGPLQGSRTRSVRPECMTPEFREEAAAFVAPQPFSDALRNLQYRDTRYTKIPRVLRFNDRISMMHSTELREPFLDHRLFELAFRQPTKRKIQGNVQKSMLRQVARTLLPAGVVEAPKRPVQTPQREWLRGPLQPWAHDCIEEGLRIYGGIWLDDKAVHAEWKAYGSGESDNSFYIWQWISLGLLTAQSNEVTATPYLHT